MGSTRESSWALVRSVKMITVEPVLFLYMLATFMQYTVFQDLVYKKVCNMQPNMNMSLCDDLTNYTNEAVLSEIQQVSSHLILLSTVALTLPSIIVANFLGAYSDVHGRKIPVILPSVGMILACVIYIAIAVFPEVPVELIILASGISGVFGGFVSCIMAVMSYVSTITTAQNRTLRVGLLEAMTFLGGTVGPFLGGAIFSSTNSHALVFLVILCVYCLIVMYIILLIPEVTTDETDGEQGASACAQYMSCENFIGSVKTFFKKRDGKKRLSMILLLLAAFVYMIVYAGEMDVAFLFTRNVPLLWDYETYSYYFGLKYGLGAVALIAAMPIARSFFIRDTILCVVGVVSKIAGLVLHGLSTNSLMMFLVAPVSMLSTLTIPSIRALLSKMVSAQEQGKMFAFFASVENLCTLFGSLIFNSLYPATLSFFRGFVFEFAAVLLVISLVMISVVDWILSRNSEDTALVHDCRDQDDEDTEGSQ